MAAVLPRSLAWLLVPVLYYLGARIGVLAALMPEGIALLWPSNAVLLTAMLLRPRREMPVVGLLGIATEVAADLPTFPLADALTFGLSNALEAALACLLLRASQFDPRLPSLTDLRKFLILGPVVAALTAAGLGALFYAPRHGGWGAYPDLLRTWWLGDGMGLIIFTPLLLSVALKGHAERGFATGHRFNAADALVLSVGAAITAAIALADRGAAFGMHLSPVLTIPFVVYVAARFDMQTVSAVVAGISLLVCYLAAHGGHPFGAVPADEASLRVQEFIVTMSIPALGLAALLRQLRVGRDELLEANGRLDQLNRVLEARVAERTAQLDASNLQLQKAALTDALTGLRNRRALMEQAQGALDAARRHQRPLTIVMIDIDHFKSINDNHGHAAGDQVLAHVAETLAAQVRGGDILARYGGEEFVVLAPDTDLSSGLALARRMGDSLREGQLVLDGRPITLTASFGLTLYGGADDNLERLLLRADAALYQSKHAGRDRATALTAQGEVFANVGGGLPPPAAH